MWTQFYLVDYSHLSQDKFFRSLQKHRALGAAFCCCCCSVASVVSDSVRPHRWQPTRLPRPWDSPGKNTGVGCHFPFQCMKVKSESEVAQSCPTLSDPRDCSPPGCSVHGICQARVLEWGAIASSELPSTWSQSLGYIPNTFRRIHSACLGQADK